MGAAGAADLHVLQQAGAWLLTLLGFDGMVIVDYAQKPKRHGDVTGTARSAIDEGEARDRRERQSPSP